MSRTESGLHRRRYARAAASIGAAAATAATATLLAVAPASPAAAAAGDAHLVASSANGRLFQATRAGNGAWSEIVDLESVAGEIGVADDVATELIAGQLHVLATENGTVFHALRRTNGTWTSFSSVENQSGEIGTVIDVVAASVSGSLHVLARAGNEVYHTVRASNGSWTSFVDVTDLAGDPGDVRDVAAAGFANGELRVAVATTGGGLFQTVRSAAGAWAPFSDVKPETGDPGAVDRVAVAAVGTAMHVLVSTGTGGLRHAVRASNGTWTDFGNVKGQTGDPGPVLDVAASGHPSGGGQLQITVTTVGSLFTGGGMFHAIRRANGTWTSFGTVPSLEGGPDRPSLVWVAITGE